MIILPKNGERPNVSRDYADKTAMYLAESYSAVPVSVGQSVNLGNVPKELLIYINSASSKEERKLYLDYARAILILIFHAKSYFDVKTKKKILNEEGSKRRKVFRYSSKQVGAFEYVTFTQDELIKYDKQLSEISFIKCSDNTIVKVLQLLKQLTHSNSEKTIDAVKKPDFLLIPALNQLSTVSTLSQGVEKGVEAMINPRNRIIMAKTGLNHMLNNRETELSQVMSLAELAKLGLTSDIYDWMVELPGFLVAKEPGGHAFASVACHNKEKGDKNKAIEVKISDNSSWIQEDHIKTLTKSFNEWFDVLEPDDKKIVDWSEKMVDRQRRKEPLLVKSDEQLMENLISCFRDIETAQKIDIAKVMDILNYNVHAATDEQLHAAVKGIKKEYSSAYKTLTKMAEIGFGHRPMSYIFALGVVKSLNSKKEFRAALRILPKFLLVAILKLSKGLGYNSSLNLFLNTSYIDKSVLGFDLYNLGTRKTLKGFNGLRVKRVSNLFNIAAIDCNSSSGIVSCNGKDVAILDSKISGRVVLGYSKPLYVKYFYSFVDSIEGVPNKGQLLKASYAALKKSLRAWTDLEVFLRANMSKGNDYDKRIIVSKGFVIENSDDYNALMESANALLCKKVGLLNFADSLDQSSGKKKKVSNPIFSYSSIKRNYSLIGEYKSFFKVRNQGDLDPFAALFGQHKGYVSNVKILHSKETLSNGDTKEYAKLLIMLEDVKEYDLKKKDIDSIRREVSSKMVHAAHMESAFKNRQILKANNSSSRSQAEEQFNNAELS